MPNLHETLQIQQQNGITKHSRVVPLQGLHISASAFSKTSKEFHHMRVPLGKIPMIFAAGALADGPIVLDRNYDRIGQLNCSYVPPVVAISGTDKLRELKKNRDGYANAWVGNRALRVLKLHASDAISNNDLEAKLRLLIQDAYGKKNKANAPYDYETAYPYIVDVYQGDANYLIFRLGKAYFQQNFKIDSKTRNVSLDGTKQEVVQTYKPAPTGDISSAAFDTWKIIAPTAAIGNTTLSNLIYSNVPRVHGGYKGPTDMMQPGIGGVDFVHYGAPNSELNNPGLRLMDNVEEALGMYLQYVRDGIHEPVGKMGLVAPPLYMNAAAETRIALKAHPEVNENNFSTSDFLMWQNKTLRIKANAQTKVVNGDRLTSADFAYVGDPQDISTWHLPIASKAQIEQSLRASSTCSAVPKFERDEVRQKLRETAHAFGINAGGIGSGRHKGTVSALSRHDVIKKAVHAQLKKGPAHIDQLLDAGNSALGIKRSAGFVLRKSGKIADKLSQHKTNTTVEEAHNAAMSLGAIRTKPKEWQGEYQYNLHSKKK